MLSIIKPYKERLSIIKPYKERLSIIKPYKERLSIIKPYKERLSIIKPYKERLSIIKPYKERLSILKLPTLECRRTYNDLIFLFKIVHGLSVIFLRNMFPPIAYNSNLILRHHPHQLNLPLPRTDLLKFSFHYRSVKTWNSLIAYAVLPLLHLFKNCSCLIYVKPYLINSITYNEL